MSGFVSLAIMRTKRALAGDDTAELLSAIKTLARQAGSSPERGCYSMICWSSAWRGGVDKPEDRACRFVHVPDPDATIGAEKPIPEEIDHRKIAFPVAVVDKMELLLSPEPGKAAKP